MSQAAKVVYQFKITLLHIQPDIWRRIQVSDGTLDDLHEFIQAAMGWTNSHLHQFTIDGQHYGDPALLEDDMGDNDCEDSTATRLSKLLARRKPSYRFEYEYDFGDGWEHEIVYEGPQPVKPKQKYPCCIDGARACPPEDIGGSWGYEEFLAAIRDRKHDEHDAMLEWVGGSFNSDRFSTSAATRAMRKRLPNWRELA